MFTFSACMILTFIVAIIAFWVRNSIAKDVVAFGSRRTARAYGGTTAAILIVTYMALSAFGSWVIGANSGPAPARPATNNEVAADIFGFVPGNEYDLKLSGQVTGIKADANASMGFFSSVASATINGGSAITVSFTSDKEYTLTLPRDKAPIQIDNNPGHSPKMVVRFRPSLYTAQGNFDRTWSGCSFAISNLVPACKRVATVSNHVTINRAVRDQGLGQLVADSFESAQLIMTQDMRDKLLGAIN